jgi:hypothetical protein
MYTHEGLQLYISTHMKYSCITKVQILFMMFTFQLKTSSDKHRSGDRNYTVYALTPESRTFLLPRSCRSTCYERQSPKGGGGAGGPRH